MYTLVLKNQEVIGESIHLFTFERPRGFTWEAGQHVMVTLPAQEGQEADSMVRALSIVSAPHEQVIQFISHIPASPSPFKQALSQLKPGDTIECTEPQGRFVFQKDKAEHIFLAGGIGIGAVRAILRDLEHKNVALKGKLVYVTEPGEEVFRDELDAYQQRHPDFYITRVLKEEVQEKGGIKEIEQQENVQYYFSGIYARSDGQTEPASPQERQEVELLHQASQLVD